MPNAYRYFGCNSTAICGKVTVLIHSVSKNKAHWPIKLPSTATANLIRTENETELRLNRCVTQPVANENANEDEWGVTNKGDEYYNVKIDFFFGGRKNRQKWVGVRIRKARERWGDEKHKPGKSTKISRTAKKNSRNVAHPQYTNE